MSILIVSHDAGGANIIASYIAYKKLKCIFYIKGPAKTIFLTRLGKNIKQIETLELGIEQCKYVVCGSGDQSNLEKEVIKEAKKRKKYVICFIDHWINYRERFILKNKIILPDQIVVSDEEAFRLANLYFKKTFITKQNNYYISEILEKIKIEEKKIIKGNKKRILYLSEPIKDYVSYYPKIRNNLNYDEYNAIKLVYEKFNKNLDEYNEIIIRMHPSESIEKYKNIIKNFGNKYKLSSNTELYIDIAKADIIIGCETMAMMIAYLANKQILCSIPTGGGNCRLPINNLRYIRDI